MIVLVPAPPSDVSLVNITQTDIVVSFTSVENASYYIVNVSPNNPSIQTAVTQVTIPNRIPGTNYTITVQAVGASMSLNATESKSFESEVSVSLDVTTGKQVFFFIPLISIFQFQFLIGMNIFAVPPNVEQTSIMLSAQNSAGFTLSFNESQSASYYIVTASPNNQSFDTVVKNITINSVVFENLDFGMTYDVSFVAVNEYGQSGPVVASPQPQTSK